MARMDLYLNFSLLVYIIFVVFNIVKANNIVHRRFEYKYSFKPPYLAQKDGSVPFWEYGGSKYISSTRRVTGRGRVGADGLAFWYTQSKGSYDGDVFGSSDKWVGLGIFFDSFDNDNKHNNPYIMGVLNDGTKVFDHKQDGTTQLLAGCLRDFRNKPFPTRARIEYFNNVLTLLFHNGMTNNDKDYEMCFRVENVALPKGGYFGLSAATGGLADDHDVFHFLTTSLHSDPAQQGNIPGEDSQKLSQEYLEYQQKLEQQKQDYRKEHPDEAKEQNYDEWFESDNQRELRQIFQGQSQMFEVLKDLSRKLDEVIGRQERTLSLVSSQQLAPGQAVPQGQVPPQPQGGYPDTIRRNEVDTILNNQNTISNAAREIRQFVLELKTRADTIINNQAKQPTAQVQSVGYDTQSLISELRDGMNSLKQNYGHVVQKLTEKQTCPTTNYVSVSMVLGIAALQLIILLGYSMYRDSRENQAKKFY
ncbi:vesicular mannose-binding lectin [Holotrichia oblita]|uniref:Vesicular mannose-binding lectin n=1 Tax=Holotrichia oblita TaxID=644536 RepID=A0ACB9TJU9_HOLOL|nr:vesicular mannose-binding lectin [Holotrichia oblita]